MRPEDFKSEDLFAQIQGLADGLAAERQAREAAERADTAKSELLSVVGRELRTPMEAIIAMAELLLDSSLDPTQRRYAKTLGHSVKSLLGVLNDVLDFTRLESGQLDLATRSFDLHALVNSVASDLHERASEKGLTSGVDIGANCPRFIVGDEERIRQILMSLMAAALRSTSEGCIRLYVSASDAEERPTVRFDITDTGAGLSKTAQQRLFEASAGPEGGGLGLAIARRLAEAMGGAVGCDSALGQGTLYWLTLDAARGQSAAEEVKDVSPQGTLSGHVLVIEDNTVNRMLIGAYLEEFGLTHEMVGTGTAAVMNLMAKSYDLVLMDTALPDIDAGEAVKRIRALRAPSSDVPIVALAARGTQNGHDHIAAGMNACLSKPIRGRELHATLAPFLGGKKSEAEAKAS